MLLQAIPRGRRRRLSLQLLQRRLTPVPCLSNSIFYRSRLSPPQLGTGTWCPARASRMCIYPRLWWI